MIQLRKCDDLVTSGDPTMRSSEQQSVRGAVYDGQRYVAAVSGRPPKTNAQSVTKLSSFVSATPGEGTRGKSKTGGAESSLDRASRARSRQQASQVVLEGKQKNDYFRRKIEAQYRVERSSRSREALNHSALVPRGTASRSDIASSMGTAEAGQRPASRHRFTPNSS